jgi:hypothetical protein
MNKLSQINDIFTGWGNYFLDQFNLLSPELKLKAENKLSICHNCIVRTDKYCDSSKSDIAVKDFMYNGEDRTKGSYYFGCGCPLDKKALSDSKCPIGKF